MMSRGHKILAMVSTLNKPAKKTCFEKYQEPASMENIKNKEALLGGNRKKYTDINNIVHLENTGTFESIIDKNNDKSEQMELDFDIMALPIDIICETQNDKSVENCELEIFTDNSLTAVENRTYDNKVSDDDDTDTVVGDSDSDYLPSDLTDEDEVTEHVNQNNTTPKYDFKIDEKLELDEPKEKYKERSEHEETQESEENVFIRKSVKSNIGKRIRNKFHCCYYCNKLYKELSKHLTRRHEKEIEVAKLLAMENNSVERRKGFIRLSRVGDYYHNLEILKRKTGELILVRLPTPEERAKYSYRDYGPCPDCLGFMLKRHLWHHVKYSCVEVCKNSDNLRRKVVSESAALLAHTYSDVYSTADFQQHIITPLKNDVISLICKQDNLILKLGVMQFEKYHTTQNDLIRQTMRQTARLVLELRRIDPSKTFLSSWLKPNCFDNIVAAVKNICKVCYTTKQRPQFSVPSLALKLGYSLKKRIAIEKGICLRKEDPKGVETLNSLLSIMELEWSTRVSSSALATLYHRKLNPTELLPLTDDLVKLNNFLDTELKKAKCAMSDSCTFKEWSYLASIILCKIVLFNKRRSGEASRLTVVQYASRPNWSHNCAAEFQKTFTELEIQLASRLTIVQVVGKRGNIVKLLLTPDIKEAIDSLLKYRTKFSASENPYLFSRNNPSSEYIRGHDCLRNFSQQVGLVQPELITATKLRKYVATVCQIFNLTENETDWLAKHLGHDIRVHRQFYRLHESSVELTKVSRLLLAVEKGEASHFRGKKLDEINICDLPELLLEEDQDLDDTAKETIAPPEIKLRSGDAVANNVHHKVKKSKDKQASKRGWTREESSAVLDFFRNFVKVNRTPPGKQLCIECIDANPVLSSRQWKHVKYFMYNHLKKIYKR